MPSVHVQRATPETFQRYGKVVAGAMGAPTSQAADYRFWSDLANYTIEGETEIGLCTVYRQPAQRISSVERHLRTPELLVPIDAPFVLPLFHENEGGAVEAFEVRVGEAVVIDPGVWHGPCLPVGVSEASYFVIFRRRTPHEDVEKRPITPTEIRP